MKLLEIKVILPKTKPRNPNQEVLAAKKNAGGPMKKPREGVPRDEKYKKPVETSEAVAGPFEKFSKDERVKVKKTGEEVTVVSQNDIGLVFTKADDAKAHFYKGSAQSKGYKEYMPRELERMK